MLIKAYIVCSVDRLVDRFFVVHNDTGVCSTMSNLSSVTCSYTIAIYSLDTCACVQHHVDPALGVYVIDRYTYHALEFLEGVQPGSTKTMGQFVSLSDVWGDVW